MASALMAFVQGLAAEQEAPGEAQAEAQPAAHSEDDLFEEDSGHEEAPATLLAVAQQQRTAANAQALAALAALAAEVGREDQAAVQQAVDKAASEVRAERQQAVAAKLQEAAIEQYEADEFEADEAVKSLQLAEKELKAEYDDGWEGDATPKMKAKTVKKKAKKEKQTPRTMRDKLSAFQGRMPTLTLTQRRLLLATLADDCPQSKATRRAVNMEAISALATDRRRQQKHHGKPRAEFARLDDSRHCRFRPRLRAGGGSRETQADEDGGGGSNSRGEDLVRRMEAAERARVEGLRRTREEKLYLARVDKKECPTCGSAQSYAELSQKRTKCPNCGATYHRRIAWSAIADDFLARLETLVAAREKARAGSEPPTEANGEAMRAKTPLAWHEVRDEFLGRVQQDLARRELTKAAVWEEMAAEWTFRPVVTRRAKALAVGEFDERMKRDLEARRQRQEQYARLRQALAGQDGVQDKPRAARGKTAYAPSAPFQERLRLDLQRRREREQEQHKQEKKPPTRQLPRAC